MHRHLPLLLALVVAAPALAQDAFTPGHPDIGSPVLGTERLPYNYVIRVKQGAVEQDIGTAAFSVLIDEDEGRVEAIRAYEMMGQKFADTLVVEWPSLAAISHVSNNGQRILRFAVDDGMISGARTTGAGAPQPFEMSADGPFFDASWMSIIASALPLADGYEVAISAFEDDEAGMGDFTLAASGPVSLDLGGEKHDVWEVAATNPAGEVVRYFLTALDHTLLRVAMNPQPGLEVFIDADFPVAAGK